MTKLAGIGSPMNQFVPGITSWNESPFQFVETTSPFDVEIAIVNTKDAT
jgi:hypothetical protein